MATKARQQYFADEDSLQKIRREFSIADDIQQKIDSIEEGAQVNVIETVKVNGTPLIPDANKAVNVEVPEVIDNLYTIDSDNALSAKQGKLLYDYIQNIASRGRFLSNWNSATGLPMTNPSESPYPYKSGDYFVVSNIAGLGGTNYRPDGSSYIIGQASTVVETESVDVSDFYFYDGTTWLLLKNSSRSGAVDSSLSTTSTNPVENRVITQALNGKQDTLIAGTNIQIAADGKTISATDTTYTAGTGINIDANNVISNMQTSAEWGNITGTLSNQTDLQNALNNKANKTDVLEKTNTTSYTPSGDYNPATKKYVDDSISAIDVGDKIVYATQAEYNALLPGAASDGKHYFIYSTSGGGGWQPGVNTIAYYPLNSTYTDTDQSGNNNNGTTTGTIIYDSISGEFSSNNYIDIPTVIPYGSNPFTISVWCIAYSVSGNQYHVFNQFNSSSNNTAIDVYINNGTINIWSKGSNDWNNIVTISANTWYNFVLTYNGSTLTFYKNGISAGTKNRTISSTSPNYAWIGKGGELAGPSFFGGKISNLIIENKVRTAQEVSDYYDLTKGDYGIS